MAVSEQFLLLAMEAGLPPVRLHDLRHGAATILLRAGHDLKVVQETLGLSSITIASDTYTSVLPDLARQSAEDAAAVILNVRTRPTERQHLAVSSTCRRRHAGDRHVLTSGFLTSVSAPRAVLRVDTDARAVG